MSGPPKLAYCDDLCVAAEWELASLLYVRSGISALCIEASHATAHRLAARHGKVVSLAVIDASNVALPGPDVRAAAAWATRDAPKALVAAATVILGEGFFVSTVRSIVTSIEMMQAKGQTRRSFADLDASTRWLASGLGQSPAWAARLASAAASLAADRPLRAHG